MSLDDKLREYREWVNSENAKTLNTHPSILQAPIAMSLYWKRISLEGYLSWLDTQDERSKSRDKVRPQTEVSRKLGKS